MNKVDRKLLKLQKKADKCLTRDKAQKILKKVSKLNTHADNRQLPA